MIQSQAAIRQNSHSTPPQQSSFSLHNFQLAVKSLIYVSVTQIWPHQFCHEIIPLKFCCKNFAIQFDGGMKQLQKSYTYIRHIPTSELVHQTGSKRLKKQKNRKTNLKQAKITLQEMAVFHTYLCGQVVSLYVWILLVV